MLSFANCLGLSSRLLVTVIVNVMEIKPCCQIGQTSFKDTLQKLS